MSGLYSFDNAFRKDHSIIAGIDEAGRGPIAGPVVAACVRLPGNKVIRGLRDSKLIPEKDRPGIFRKIIACALDVGVGISDVDTIESLNIYEATRLAMRRAISHLRVKPDLLLIDAVRLPEVKTEQVSIFKGELQSASIAAASVVAKYLRDRLMTHYHKLYPAYGFDRHKGYCTRGHLRKVAELGPCPLHRKTFHGVLSLELPFSLEPPSPPSFS
jgi:ribonuclease HII